MRFFQSKRMIPLLAILLILAGIFFAVRFTRRAGDSYRAMQFAVQNDFDAGNLDVALVQPWMHIRYIAEAYAVPQIFLFEQLNIPMRKPTSQLPIGRLNKRFRLGQVDDEPVIVGMIQQAILDYRQNPVVTGLAEREVQRWMNIQYIANSTGIPVEILLDAVDIPVEGNVFKPLGWLVDSTEYEAGLDHLLDTLQQVVDENEVAPQ